MDLTPVVEMLASHGPLGAMIVVLGWVAWRKDLALQAERDARIADAKSYTELALKLQAQVIDAVNRLSNILEEMKKLMAGRITGSGQ